MSGVMPAGQKAFSNINTVAGQPSTNQINLGSTAAQYLGNVPSTTWVRMSDMSGRGLRIGYKITSPLNAASPIGILSPYGSSVTSPWVDLNTCSPATSSFGTTWSNFPNGTNFFIFARMDATWATINPTPTHTFVKGSSAAFQTGGTGGNKNNYMVTEYDATNNRVRVYKYYGGPNNTDNENGIVYMDGIHLV